MGNLQVRYMVTRTAAILLRVNFSRKTKNEQITTQAGAV